MTVTRMVVMILVAATSMMVIMAAARCFMRVCVGVVRHFVLAELTDLREM